MGDSEERTPPTEKTATAPPEGRGMNAVRVGFAVVLGVVFICLATLMALNADTGNDVQWQRWAGLFAAIEALAFTAIGWVFGREINRERAEGAERRAGGAERDRGEARERAAREHEKGKSLARQIVARADLARGGGRLEAQGAGQEPGDANLDVLAEVARREYGV